MSEGGDQSLSLEVQKNSEKMGETFTAKRACVQTEHDFFPFLLICVSNIIVIGDFSPSVQDCINLHIKVVAIFLLLL